VKKIIIAAVLVSMAGACRSSSTTVGTSSQPVLNGNQTGAPDALSAVRAFMTAAKQQDLQAMGAIWGGPAGPARDLWGRQELEKRELIMMCYLKHDRYEVIGDAPSPGGTRAYALNLSYRDLTRSTTFQLVQGPAGRWYVKEADIKTLQDICSRKA
jgi:hypothetical protein